MKPRNREINIFNISMLDVISGALGAFLIIMIVLFPYYKKESIDYQRDIQELRKQVQAANQKTKEAELHSQEIEKQLQEARQKIQEAQQRARNAEERLGFALKDKNIVFIVDISGSMANNNKISQVTTGIKMLVATMDRSYKIDIVFFPNDSHNSDYGYLWGNLREVTEDRKYTQIYSFLSSLEANGGTPTGGVMDFVLSGNRYSNAGTIILLSDGEPDRNPNTLISVITSKNNNRKKINTIGVGKDFRDRNSSSDAVRFLQELAKRNNGFYVGF